MRILPPNASVDALHIAHGLSAHHEIQYLLTWNCKHIANAKILPRIHQVLTDLGPSRFRSFARRKKWWTMNPKITNHDTILDEIHRTRQLMAEKFGGDIAAILEDARKRQEASGRAIWQGPASNKALNPTGNKPAS